MGDREREHTLDRRDERARGEGVEGRDQHLRRGGQDRGQRRGYDRHRQCDVQHNAARGDGDAPGREDVQPPHVEAAGVGGDVQGHEERQVLGLVGGEVRERDSEHDDEQAGGREAVRAHEQRHDAGDDRDADDGHDEGPIHGHAGDPRREDEQRYEHERVLVGTHEGDCEYVPEEHRHCEARLDHEQHLVRGHTHAPDQRLLLHNQQRRDHGREADQH